MFPSNLGTHLDNVYEIKKIIPSIFKFTPSHHSLAPQFERSIVIVRYLNSLQLCANTETKVVALNTVPQ